MFKKFISYLVLGSLLITACKHKQAPIPTKKEEYNPQASVVKLDSKVGSCSGEQIETPSGKKYILTADHCAPIAVDGRIRVTTEDAGVYYSKIVLEDETSDLMLIEAAPGIPAVKIAGDMHRHEHLTSYTHGHGYPTYSTEGIYIGEDIIQFLDEVGTDNPDLCNKPKNKKAEVDFFGIHATLCAVEIVESVTTVPAVPGSSGGMVVNDNGELVGIVSTGDDHFTNLVTLKDIHHFIDKQ